MKLLHGCIKVRGRRYTWRQQPAGYLVIRDEKGRLVTCTASYRPGDKILNRLIVEDIQSALDHS